VGDGSPSVREAEGEGGEGFYIAQSGWRADFTRISGAGGRQCTLKRGTSTKSDKNRRYFCRNTSLPSHLSLVSTLELTPTVNTFIGV
jgi:hypothetical protein